jgi:uncharacterized phage-like protein YoqJ
MAGIIPTTEYDLPKELSVCFTGHRPDRLPWGAREWDERCEAFKNRLRREIRRAYEKGARYFLSGMAEGVDTYAAKAVLGLSATLPEMKLVAVFPYGAPRNAEQRRIAERAFRAVSIRPEYSPGCFSERNRFLVEHSSAVIAGFGGDPSSGTGATLKLAIDNGLGITIIGFDER